MHDNKEDQIVLQTRTEIFKPEWSGSVPLEAGLSSTPIFTLIPTKPRTLMASNCGHRVEIMGPTQAWDPLHQFTSSKTEALPLLSWKVGKRLHAPRHSHTMFSRHQQVPISLAPNACKDQRLSTFCAWAQHYSLQNFLGHYRCTMLQILTLTKWIQSSMTILYCKIVRMLNIPNFVSIYWHDFNALCHAYKL